MKPERNGPCPCGSGKKYKKCCLAQAQDFAGNAAKAEARAAKEQLAQEREAPPATPGRALARMGRTTCATADGRGINGGSGRLDRPCLAAFI